MARGVIFAVILVALAAAAPAARADFRDGVKAFRAAEYALAHAEWMPLAEAGNPPAQYNVGILFQYGLGVAKDFAEAARWYRLAADNAHPNAQAKLGYLLARGFGVAKDFAASARWFREAAEQGVADAQFNIGVMYATGSGIEYDAVQGLMWLNLAHGAGVPEAAERRDVLVTVMSADEIEEAALLAEFLRPTAEAPATPDDNETGFAEPPPPAPEPPGPAAPAQDVAAAEPDAEPDAEAAPGLDVEPVIEIDTTPELPPTPATSVSASLALALVTLAPPPPVPAAGDVVVHLASYRTAAAASDGWAKLRTIHADLLGGLGHDIVTIDLGEQGVFFRLLAGPVADAAGAETLCSRLKDRNVYCAAAY